ncbi:SCO family protein [Paenibacillus sp. N3.4]|uniref:SCO family protein n=1 Tax=Paenibacillus sp. N3.4 TaxID=2603222 RepID=UPI0011C96D05|nr:SCO family protein [Paenibacillus sp. N3.4]TXK85006.1 SCO family protein [Paenibacillus sp. N3.4]
MSVYSSTNKAWFRITAIVLFAAIILCAVYWFLQGTDPLPKIKKAPEFSLQNLKGQQVKLSETNGKVRLVEFFFANCPDICPVTTSNMVLMQNNLKKKGTFGSKVEFLSVTFDPERDTPEALEKYASALGIEQGVGWQLLRGSEQDVLKTANDFGIMAVKQKDGQFVHSIRSLFLIDQEGTIRKVYDMGEGMDNEIIEKAIKQLVKAS